MYDSRSCDSANADNATIAGLRSPNSAVIRFKASSPHIPGIRISMNTIEGNSGRIISNASGPLPAILTEHPIRESICAKTSRFSRTSSTTSALTEWPAARHETSRVSEACPAPRCAGANGTSK